MNKIDIFLLITVNPFPPGHDREVVLELVTPIAVEGDPVGLHPLLLEGVAPLLEGDKHLLADIYPWVLEHASQMSEVEVVEHRNIGQQTMKT